MKLLFIILISFLTTLLNIYISKNIMLDYKKENETLKLQNKELESHINSLEYNMLAIIKSKI